MEHPADRSGVEPDVVRRRLPLYLLGPRDLPLTFAQRWWQWARRGAALPPRAAMTQVKDGGAQPQRVDLASAAWSRFLVPPGRVLPWVPR